MTTTQTEPFLNLYLWEPGNAKPFIYLAPGENSYFVINALGKFLTVPDLKGVLDWWIKAPWLVDASGRSIELHGNA